VTAEAAYAFADVDGQELALEGTAVPAGVRETCRDCRNVSKRFSLRTPPWSVVTATLTDTFRPEVCADFKTSIETLETLEDPLVNEADSALLVAARHELLLYNLSNWAEDIQFYSKATFSRAKNKLEDLGIVVCEDVRMAVGRPRERLTLTEEYASLSEAALLRELDTIKRE
jgi:hypothetical protein